MDIDFLPICLIHRILKLKDSLSIIKIAFMQNLFLKEVWDKGHLKW